MTRVCVITGKKTRTGYYVSKSNKHVKRKFFPNLQYKKIYIPQLKKWIRVRISAEALRWISKNGIEPYLHTLLKNQKKLD